ncbi:MAG: hypothetical protein GFH27_549321n61 [Chloroflexi bacterium AL-W]|nr:hypothetical protein [Chloroflexi bacterium AL-N1]NOK64939.1 hypothetical protein [Chloroflexi bacterium AL-N10]NOK76709.1 hypothetical protein [Chloroflexi bacterium AL-N5]NOK84600.1 hypothetical protein [Chloroflexi bacterium AL-W]NOK86575.1 hypothetical protein [Chloroflexi bacterium AL-N15]
MAGQCLRLMLFFVVIIIFAPVVNATTFVARVSTLAGSAQNRGDANGSGASARFDFPYDIALSGDGTFALVTDARNNTVRRLDLPTREVTTLAGAAGIRGQADGTGTDARFAYPSGIALNSDGTLALVVDTDNHTIRTIDIVSDAVATIAGTAGTSGSSNGSGASVRFNAPQSIALSTDETFAVIADTDNHTIRRLDLTTREVTTLAGQPGEMGDSDGIGPAARFASPRGIAFDPAEQFVLIADSENHTLRRLDLTTGQVTTIVGQPGEQGVTDGGGREALLSFPRGLSISTDGTFALVADFSNSTIRQIALDTNSVTTLAGSPGMEGSTDSAGNSALFANPSGVALSSDSAFALVTDTSNHTIRQLSFVEVTPRAYLPIIQAETP